MKITANDKEQLLQAIQINLEIKTRLNNINARAQQGLEIDENELWDLRNRTKEVTAVLHNIHEDVYNQPSAFQRHLAQALKEQVR